ncbi:MAG: hypothetical protein K5883_06370 [Pseudobutyrivibrio sp.]|nr:hypothetical protein [Pseudobutyrivibrio sp.]
MLLSIYVGNAAIVQASELDDAAIVTELSADDAANIAISDAGFTEKAAKYTNVWEDTVDGTAVYKVMFYVGPVEFIYQIDKGSSDIISKIVND